MKTSLRTQTGRKPAICVAACAVLLAFMAAAMRPGVVGTAVPTTQTGKTYRLTVQDQALLQDLTKRLFRFFIEHSSPASALVDDRARADGARYQPPVPASIAATGFGLTALSIAPDQGWLPMDQARKRIRASLKFLADRAPQVHGWFYHFLDSETGERRNTSEVSSIDTALLLCGVLEARQRFSADTEIRKLADRIYERAGLGKVKELGSAPGKISTRADKRVIRMIIQRSSDLSDGACRAECRSAWCTD